jgi:hypothetical protein
LIVGSKFFRMRSTHLRVQFSKKYEYKTFSQ